VQGVLPHVAPRQRLVMGEDDGVVLGVGLVAPLPDPAVVVGEGVVKPPGRQGEDSVRMNPPAHGVPPPPGMALLARPRCGCSCCGVKLLLLHPFHRLENRGTTKGFELGTPAPTELPSPAPGTSTPEQLGAEYSPAGGKK